MVLKVAVTGRDDGVKGHVDGLDIVLMMLLRIFRLGCMHTILLSSGCP